MTELLREFRLGFAKDHLLAPFSKRDAGKLALSRESRQMQAVMPFLVVSRDDHLAYVKNSKCGCTSITQALHYYDAGRFYKGNVHREGGHLRQGYSCWQENWKSVESGRPFLFSFVRNPVARVVSAYMDFVIMNRNPEAVQHTTAFARRGLDRIDDKVAGLDRFLDLIAEEFAVDPILSDRHWRPQFLNLGDSLFDLQLIGKMERFTEDIGRLCEASGVPPERFPVTTANRSGSEALTPTVEQRRRIRDLYTMDYEAYGY